MYFVDAEGNLYLKHVTRNSNAATTADAAPSYRVYGTGTSALLTGTMGSGIVDSQTGLYAATLACTAANGFAAGQSYLIIITYLISSASKTDLVYVTVR